MSAEPLAGETYMLGWVANGTDSYLISGDISRFHFDESVNIYVNEEVVENPVQFVWTALTFKSTDRDHATDEFSVSGAIYSEDRHHLDRRAVFERLSQPLIVAVNLAIGGKRFEGDAKTIRNSERIRDLYLGN